MLLAVLFLFPAIPSAFADETVTGLRLESGNLPDPLFVDEGSYSVKLWASVAGSSSEINATSEATWTSTNPAAVKVDKGVLTVLSASDSVTILAKYKGFTKTIDVKSQYRYTEAHLRVKDQSANAGAELDAALGGSLELGLWAINSATGTVGTDVKDVADWESSDTDVATVAKGVVVLKALGETTITAKFGGRSDSVVVNVESPYDSISISPEGVQELKVGEQKDLAAVAKLTAGGTGTVTGTADWTSSNANVVTVEKGKLTAKGAGLATVSVQQYGESDSVTVVVTTPFEGVRIVPDKPVTVALQGDPIPLQLFVMNSDSDTPADVAADPVTVWEVEKLEFASVKKAADGKMYIYPRMPGTTKIKGTYKGLSKEVSVTVFPTITSISLDKDELNVLLKDTLTLPAVSGITLSGDTIDVSAMVQWQAESVTQEVLKFENGKWVIQKPGTVTLTAKLLNKPGDPSPKTATLQVTVSRNPLTLVADEENLSVILGKSTALPTVKLWYEDGEFDDVSTQVTWKSSGNSIVVAGGVIKGITAGKATLTGTYAGKSVRVSVTSEEEFTSFKIDPKQLALTVGSSKSIKVTAKTAKGKSVTLSTRLEWSSSNDDIVDIRGSSVKALAEGSGKLTAKIQGNELTVNFTAVPKLNKLVSSSKSIEAAPGGASTTLKLDAEYNTGKVSNVTSAAVWTTTNSKVATVTGGVVKPLAKGVATIKGSYGGKYVSVRVIVK